MWILNILILYQTIKDDTSKRELREYIQIAFNNWHWEGPKPCSHHYASYLSLGRKDKKLVSQRGSRKWEENCFTGLAINQGFSRTLRAFIRCYPSGMAWGVEEMSLRPLFPRKEQRKQPSPTKCCNTWGSRNQKLGWKECECVGLIMRYRVELGHEWQLPGTILRTWLG